MDFFLKLLYIYLAQDGNCEIEDVSGTDWLTELTIDITDTDKGETFRKKTGNITGKEDSII